MWLTMSNFTRRAIYNLPTGDGRTFEGGEGFSRPARQELFLLACTELAEDTFYESAEDRQFRLSNLVKAVINEPGGWDWVCKFASWLRNDAGMRSASIMVVAEAVATRDPKKVYVGSTARQLVSSVCLRGDEPAEMLGYWLANHGRKMPSALKRGIADAAVRLYTERNVLRYDRSGSAVRMGDVIDLTHPVPSSPVQSALFHYLLDSRHRRDDLALDLIPEVWARRQLEALPPAGRHAFARMAQNEADAKNLLTKAMAGSWEWLKSWLGQV